MDPISLALGGASLIGGLFGSGRANASASTQGLYNSANNYLDYAKSQWGDPNSDYYNKAKQGQNRTMFDMLMSSNRMNNENLAGQGIKGTGKLANLFLKNAQNKAGEQANQFATGLYTQGQNEVSNAYRTHVGAYGQGAQLETQVNMFNAGGDANLGNQIAEFGAGILGQQFAPGGNTPANTGAFAGTYSGAGKAPPANIYNQWMKSNGNNYVPKFDPYQQTNYNYNESVG